MAILTAQQVLDAQALLNGRISQVSTPETVAEGLAELCLLAAPLSIAHPRLKMYWQPGQDPSIFKSERDGYQVNGWHISWTGYGPSVPVNAYQTSGRFFVQHLYRYDFGTDADNSELQFRKQCTDFLALFNFQDATIKDVGGSRFLGLSAKLGVSSDQTPAVHIMTCEMDFELCSL